MDDYIRELHQNLDLPLDLSDDLEITYPGLHSETGLVIKKIKTPVRLSLAESDEDYRRYAQAYKIKETLKKKLTRR